MRLGRLMQDKQELGLTFQNFEAERRPRAEMIVALARRNGNSKREFSATGAFIRNQMMKWLLPLGSRVTSRPSGGVTSAGSSAMRRALPSGAMLNVPSEVHWFPWRTQA